MDMRGMLAAAIRGLAGSPDAAKGLGRAGAAGRVDANARDEYIRYAEEEMARGGEPLPYARWIMQRRPTTSQVGKPFGG